MKLFSGNDLRVYLDNLQKQLTHEVEREDKNRLLNVNEAEYISYLVDTYSLTPITFHLEDKSVSSREATVTRNDPYDGGSTQVNRQIVSVHIPYTGDPHLLSLEPSNRLVWTIDVGHNDREISFDIVNHDNSAESIRREIEKIEGSLVQQAAHSQREVEGYNAGLHKHAEAVVRRRKQQHLEQSALVEALGIPVKKRDNVPETFSIPGVKKRPEIRKPKSSDEPFAAEPTLDPETYNHILRICRDTGVEIERHPSLYADKDEETLRDHLLMVLSPHFESVTGETFNKTGKTDILIRHERSNAFIAECKFWSGPKAHHTNIDQLLGYLTWRDSKAALIYFITSQQFGPILQKIIDHTPSHSCYTRYDGEKAPGWYSYTFHLPGDETRPVHIAIQCFHFPHQPRKSATKIIR